MSQMHDDEDGPPELSNRKILQIIMQKMADLSNVFHEDLSKKILMVMQEIVDVRGELKEEIHDVKNHIVRLDGKIDDVAGELRSFRYEARQNHNSVDKRITALESAK